MTSWTIKHRSEVLNGEFWSIRESGKIIATAYSVEVAALMASAPDLLAERDRLKSQLVEARAWIIGLLEIAKLAEEVGMTAGGSLAKLLEALTEMGEEMGAALGGEAPAIHSEDCRP